MIKTSTSAQRSVTEIIQERAELYQKVRQYFHQQNVLEVEVPLLGKSSALDPHLASLSVQSQDQAYYLQTSPELFMKRLLCQGSGSIFAITKAFRESEVSSRHNPEFSMLEWYRLGFSLEELIEDVAKLIRLFLPPFHYQILNYAELFQQYLGVNPHDCSDEQLLDLVHENTSFEGLLNRPACLDLLMSQIVEPAIKDQIVFVLDYPACQAAMARVDLDAQGNSVARRFELYIHGVEVANGYDELCDPSEQRHRLKQDAKARQNQGLPEIPVDERFLSALQEQGLPDCAGVALGLDRLIWLVNRLNSGQGKSMQIGSTLLFPWSEL